MYYDGWVDLYTPDDSSTIGNPIILSSPSPSDWVNDLLVTTDSIFLTGIQSDGRVGVGFNNVDSGDIWVAKMDRTTHTIGWNDVIAGDMEKTDVGSRLVMDSLGNLHVVGTIQKSFSGRSRIGPLSTACGNSCHTDMWIRMYCPAEMGGTSIP